MKHAIKEKATKVILQLARWNNDTKEYGQMYSMAWTLLVIVGLWSSFNAGKADFSVLYGNHYNLHQNTAAAQLYAFSIALFIQCLIIIPGGVIAKIIIHKLHIERRHIFQLIYLSPILLFGMGWSTHLSLNMDQAVRAETKDDYQEQLNKLEQKLSQKDSAVLEIEAAQFRQFKNDSTLLAKAYRSDYLAKKSEIHAEVDRLEKEAQRLEKVKAGWAKAIARKYRNQSIPALHNEYDKYYSNNQKNFLAELSNLNAKYDTLYAGDIQREKIVYDTIQAKQFSFLASMEQDIIYTTRKRKGLSIMYNLLAVLIVFGAHEVYKNINHDNPTQYTPSTQIPLGTQTSSHIVHLAQPVTQGTHSQPGSTATHTPSTQVADIQKLKNYITGTYYPRSFLKSQIGDLGSSKQMYADRNREKVIKMVNELEQYGIRTEIDFTNYSTVKFS